MCVEKQKPTPSKKKKPHQMMACGLGLGLVTPVGYLIGQYFYTILKMDRIRPKTNSYLLVLANKTPEKGIRWQDRKIKVLEMGAVTQNEVLV